MTHLVNRDIITTTIRNTADQEKDQENCKLYVRCVYLQADQFVFIPDWFYYLLVCLQRMKHRTGVRFVDLGWGDVYISLLQTYTCTHKHSQGPRSPSCLKLFSMREEKQQNKKAAIGQHTRGTLTDQKRQNLREPLISTCRLSAFFNSSGVSACLKCPELQVKGNDLTLLSLHPWRAL